MEERYNEYNYNNETEHIVFEDYAIKIINNDSSSEGDDDENDVLYKNFYKIEELFNNIKNYSAYSTIGFLDDLQFSDLLTFMETLQDEIGYVDDVRVLKEFQPFPKFHNMKYPSVHNWKLHYMENLMYVYEYLSDFTYEYDIEFCEFNKFVDFAYCYSTSIIRIPED